MNTTYAIVIVILWCCFTSYLIFKRQDKNNEKLELENYKLLEKLNKTTNLYDKSRRLNRMGFNIMLSILGYFTLRNMGVESDIAEKEEEIKDKIYRFREVYSSIDLEED